MNIKQYGIKIQGFKKPKLFDNPEDLECYKQTMIERYGSISYVTFEGIKL